MSKSQPEVTILSFLFFDFVPNPVTTRSFHLYYELKSFALLYNVVRKVSGKLDIFSSSNLFKNFIYVNTRLKLLLSVSIRISTYRFLRIIWQKVSLIVDYNCMSLFNEYLLGISLNILSLILGREFDKTLWFLHGLYYNVLYWFYFLTNIPHKYICRITKGPQWEVLFTSLCCCPTLY